MPNATKLTPEKAPMRLSRYAASIIKAQATITNKSELFIFRCIGIVFEGQNAVKSLTIETVPVIRRSLSSSPMPVRSSTRTCGFLAREV